MSDVEHVDIGYVYDSDEEDAFYESLEKCLERGYKFESFPHHCSPEGVILPITDFEKALKSDTTLRRTQEAGLDAWVNASAAVRDLRWEEVCEVADDENQFVDSVWDRDLLDGKFLVVCRDVLKDYVSSVQGRLSQGEAVRTGDAETSMYVDPTELWPQSLGGHLQDLGDDQATPSAVDPAGRPSRPRLGQLPNAFKLDLNTSHNSLASSMGFTEGTTYRLLTWSDYKPYWEGNRGFYNVRSRDKLDKLQRFRERLNGGQSIMQMATKMMRDDTQLNQKEAFRRLKLLFSETIPVDQFLWLESYYRDYPNETHKNAITAEWNEKWLPGGEYDVFNTLMGSITAEQMSEAAGANAIIPQEIPIRPHGGVSAPIELPDRSMIGTAMSDARVDVPVFEDDADGATDHEETDENETAQGTVQPTRGETRQAWIAQMKEAVTAHNDLSDTSRRLKKFARAIGKHALAILDARMGYSKGTTLTLLRWNTDFRPLWISNQNIDEDDRRALTQFHDFHATLTSEEGSFESMIAWTIARAPGSKRRTVGNKQARLYAHAHPDIQRERLDKYHPGTASSRPRGNMKRRILRNRDDAFQNLRPPLQCPEIEPDDGSDTSMEDASDIYGDDVEEVNMHD